MLPVVDKLCIAFDLDGTLVDSAPDIHTIANQVLIAVGGAPITLAQARGFVGKGAGNFVAQMRALRGIPETEQSRLLAMFLERYEGAVSLSQLYPGVKEALSVLERGGHHLALCTNKPQVPTQAVLHHFDLQRFFSVVVGGDTLEVCKPDPAHLLAAFDRLDRSGKRIFVGDSEVDAETAHAAGVPFLLFTKGYRKTPIKDLPLSAVFDDHQTMPGLIQEIAGMGGAG